MKLVLSSSIYKVTGSATIRSSSLPNENHKILISRWTSDCHKTCYHFVKTISHSHKTRCTVIMGNFYSL